MSILRALGRPARLLAALVVAAATLLPAAGPALAVDVTFGRPEATAVFREGITFSVPMTASTPLDRLELRLAYPGAIGPFVETVPVAPGGTQSYRLDLSGGGHLVPNTTIEAVWAAIPAGGGEPVLSDAVTARYRDTDQEWRTLNGDLVVVHWYAGDEAFARKALRIGDQAVKATADLLGVTETEPVDFFIYPTDTSFFAALGPSTGESTVGQAHADIRTLFALIPPDQINDGEVERVIPHELVHLVFDTAVENPYRFAPRWLNEGVAVYLSEGYAPYYRNLVADGVAAGDLLPLGALAVSFPRGDKIFLAYAEAVSAIDHLVRTYGDDALYDLIAAYKDGLTDDEAFTQAVGRDVAAFQDGWLGELGAAAPEAYGPQPNPSGPLPPGWDRSVDGNGPGASAGASPGVPGAATATPGTTEPPASTGGPGTGEAPGGAGADIGLLLLAVAGVVALVIVGMVLARRRTSAP